MMLDRTKTLDAVGKALPDLLSSNNWLPLLQKTDRIGLAEKLRDKIPRFVDFAFQAIQREQQQEAVNWLALAFFCDPQAARDAIGRNGAFRCSKYGFNTYCLGQVITVLRDQASSLSLPDNVVQYLRSVANLLCAANSVRRINNYLRDFLVRHQDSALKSIVALADSFFMLGHEGDFTANSENLDFYTKEDLAEAASYIIYCFDSAIGIRDDHFNLLAERSLVRGLFNKVLIKACKVRRFCEAEILVDAFDYRCTLQRRKVRITPPVPEIEKSIRLGYVQTEQAIQRIGIDRIAAIRSGQFSSILDAADSFYDRFRDHIVKVFDYPLRRYVFRFPDVPEFRSNFSQDGLTAEEYLYLGEILSSELVTWDEIMRFEVCPGVSILDLLKMHRLFVFIARVATKHLTIVLKEDPGLAYRSLVPVFEIGQLHALLGWCLQKETIGAVINMLSWKTGTKGVMDIQYKPIINGGRYYLVPLNIAGMTNWYRNLAYTQKRRVIEVAEEEAASRALSAILGRASGKVRKGFETVLSGKRIEIDVTCRFGEYLFLFECKHALLPCNAPELRTSYDHMKTAAKQLDRITTLLSDRDVEKEFYRRLNWDVDPAKEIVTCIVSCNGMFPGLSISGHPIRRWAELKNMIETGVVRVGSIKIEKDESGFDVDAEDLIERNLWGSAQLSPVFLREYITGDWLQKTFFDAMVEWERSYRLEDWELAFSTYGLDSAAVKQAIEARA